MKTKALLILLAFALAPAIARAATITVTNTNGSGPGSLRQAIIDSTSGDTIDFGVTGMITLTSGELLIDKNLTISGPAGGLAISGNNNSRVFNVVSGTVNISGLGLTGGSVQNLLSAPNYQGGAIFNNGALTLSNCFVFRNQAFEGGGIFNSGTLTVSNSTIAGNSASGADVPGSGGGIFNVGTLTVSNSTFAYNRVGSSNFLVCGDACVNAGSAGSGGGIYNLRTLSLGNSTVSGNGALGSSGYIYICVPDPRPFRGGCLLTKSIPIPDGIAIGGGIYNSDGGTAEIFSTIVAGNSVQGSVAVGQAPDCSGTFVSTGYNLIRDTTGSAGFVNGVNHDQVGVDPLLGPLADNGGPTLTMVPLPGSPVIDQGSCGIGPLKITSDQRGLSRPYDFPNIPNANDGCDIGAVEVHPPVLLLSAASRKVHGSAGTFDVDLPLSGNPGIECRSGGVNGDYTLVFSFANTLSNVGGVSVSSGTGSVSSSAIDSNDAHNYVVALTGVTNAQPITVTLGNVTDSADGFRTVVPASMGVLLGDVNGSGLVDGNDVSAVQSHTRQAVSSTNFRYDVNTSGLIDGNDVSLVQSHTRTSLLPPLSAYYDLEGIEKDGVAFNMGGIDGDGNAISEMVIGNSVSWNGINFAIGPPSALDVVPCAGQTIYFPSAQFNAVAILALAVNGNQPTQTFTITYQDGTMTSFVQGISDWFTPQQYAGESTVVAMPYRNTSNGGQDNRTFYVYGYSFSVDASKTVSSITLPNNRSVIVLAITLAVTPVP